MLVMGNGTEVVIQLPLAAVSPTDPIRTTDQLCASACVSPSSPRLEASSGSHVASSCGLLAGPIAGASCGGIPQPLSQRHFPPGLARPAEASVLPIMRLASQQRRASSRDWAGLKSRGRPVPSWPPARQETGSASPCGDCRSRSSRTQGTFDAEPLTCRTSGPPPGTGRWVPGPSHALDAWNPAHWASFLC